MHPRGACSRISFFAAVAGLVLCGCEEKRPVENEVALVYWRTLTGAAGDAQDELARRFNAETEGISVVSEFQGSYGDLAAKLIMAAVAHTGPDITQLGTFEIRQFAKGGLLVDLKPYMEGPDGIDTSGWPGTMVSAGQVDGATYWLPFNVTVPVLYYNRAAFDAAGISGPPATWDDFFDYARALTLRDGKGRTLRYGLALWEITWPWLSAVWSEGGELTTRDYQHITLDDPIVIEIFEKIRALLRDGAAVAPDRASGGYQVAFMSGKAAMILSSPAPYQEIMKGAVGFRPGVAPYPAGAAGRVYAPGGGGVAMFAQTPPGKREAAWRFIKFLMRGEHLGYFAQRSGYVAFTKAAQEAAPGLLEDPGLKTVHEALPFLRGDFSVNMSPAIRGAFDEAYHKVIYEGADPATVLREADRKAELQREREP